MQNNFALKTFLRPAAAALVVVLAGGIAQAQSGSPELSDLLREGPRVQEDDSANFSFHAVREIGFAYGARAGLAWESRNIASELEGRESSLDRIFNFQPLMLRGGIVPPVLVMTTETYDQKNPEHVVIADAVYRIERPARFRSNPPDWREYLIRSSDSAPAGHGGWEPRTSAELKQWKQSVEEGWNSGVQQAREIFEINLSRLSRDLTGMIRYRQLLARNMVTEPVLSRSELGVTGNDEELNINEAVLVIRDRSRMQHDPMQWRSAQ